MGLALMPGLRVLGAPRASGSAGTNFEGSLVKAAAAHMDVAVGPLRPEAKVASRGDVGRHGYGAPRLPQGGVCVVLGACG